MIPASTILDYVPLEFIIREVEGELPCVVCKYGTIYYGNREAILYTEGEDEPYIYFADRIGFYWTLSAG